MILNPDIRRELCKLSYSQQEKLFTNLLQRAVESNNDIGSSDLAYVVFQAEHALFRQYDDTNLAVLWKSDQKHFLDAVEQLRETKSLWLRTPHRGLTNDKRLAELLSTETLKWLIQTCKTQDAPV